MHYNNPCLTHLAIEPLSHLAPWCQKLVLRKYAIDAWRSGLGRSTEIDEFAKSFPDKWVRSWQTVDPWSFVRVVLPFFDVAERESKGGGKENGLLWLEPSVVVGDSGGWRVTDLDERESVEALECCERQVALYLETGEWSSHVGGTRGWDPHPQSMHIAPLGLYLAHEGKNRVSLYQHLGLPMPTAVWSNRYIAPDRLTLIRTDNGWAVQLDRHETRTIGYCADIIVPMLTEYGVETMEARPRQSTAVGFWHRILASFTEQ
ncbi:hypothetical protein LGM38_02295 [Burkholderia vietnamiensis]|uniref:hypothetical protein n=1 Tax=Burkholderia vietnamiensis TaxID=60552 RepID=UPI001CF15B15|nr:hypothetical protein [Burkholderia vietnamiensis]MCA8010895.1 hypothetical protein [Burkholderia vietnamiensis]HDR8937558.1 hypothetical protein [Burkholderia vietnamiensis]HDR9263457.1 hypothetical protein [Burkholderia vietnamiensis]